MSRVFFRMLLGFLAGIVAWALVEPTNPGIENQAAWGAFEIHMMLSLGAITGLTLGFYNAWIMGGRVRMWIGGIGGPILGIIGALMGYGAGSIIQKALFGEPLEVLLAQHRFVELYLSRILALTPVGTFLGLAIGAVSLDWRRAVHGLIGGTIGGAIGGMIFDPVAVLFAVPVIAARGGGGEQEVGLVSRVALFLVMCGCIALFIGIVEQIAKQASVRLALGRNEGREFPLFGARTMVGRNELAQVPIFNDPAVAPVHAYIDRRGPVYWLMDAGSGAPTFLNGQPVSSAPLDHGAHIQVGNSVLQFLLKSLPRSMAPAGAYPVMPTPQGYGAPMPVGAPMYPTAAPIQAGPGYQAVPLSQPTTVIPAQQAMPTLVATDGPMAGQRVPVTGPVEIGREGSGLALRFDSSASRRHASVSPGPAGLMLQDLGSTNGTFVNGQRVTSATLRAGDLVKIGATTFRVE